MPSKIQILVNLTEQTAYWRGVIAGVARYCRDHADVSMRLPWTEWDLFDDRRAIDGVIAVVSNSAADDSVARFGKPVVNISAVAEAVPFPSVIIDGHAVGRLAADHLIKQGYE